MTSEKDQSASPLGLGLDYHADVSRTENKVLRAIKPQYEQLYAELIAHPVVKELIAEGLLLPVQKSAVKVANSNLVIEQPLLNQVSFPFEWTPSMLREAALLVLKLNLRLVAAGYCTQDGHPWNVLFEGLKPRFIDFTSIVKIGAKGWEGIDDFDNTCLNALKLMEKGYPTVARTLLREIRGWPDGALANAVMFNPTRHAHLGFKGDLKKMGEVASFFGGKVLRRMQQKASGDSRKNPTKAIEQRLSQIQAMDLRPSAEMWSKYYDTSADYPSYTGKKEEIQAVCNATPKHTAVSKLLNRIKPHSVLDIACNRGVYSQLAVFCGAKVVVGVDTDEQVLELMFEDSRRMGTNALPLFCNIVTPADAVGLHAKPFPTVVERLKSDVVLCLALVHHLVFKPPHLHFGHIADILASFTKNYLIVEFPPIEDKYVQESLNKRPADFRVRFGWYTLDNFKSAMEKHFDEVEILPSHPSPRVILVARKKGSPGR